ncbi:hypothetical protein L6452_31202 [Arctium lappa]|uniref:Uncharacterized protein n=1 Tax=Arctium lappa TaxID=4217 RepID=A0ACB8ZK94_ARCLA|nr:hypothetical protein L6452_31202 [Arctium lappa]
MTDRTVDLVNQRERRPRTPPQMDDDDLENVFGDGDGNSSSNSVFPRVGPNQKKSMGSSVGPTPKGAGSSGLKFFNCRESGHRQSECKKVGKRNLLVELDE